MPDELAEILAEYDGEKEALIPTLQKVQEKFGYLSEEAVSEIAKFSRMAESEIFGVASFSAQFYFTRRGQHTIKVCLDNACYFCKGEQIDDHSQLEAYSDISLKGDCHKCYCTKSAYVSWN